MSETGSAAARYERLKKGRDLVQRTALLLSADMPLQDLLSQLAILLSAFIDASIVQVAVGDADDAKLEYVFRDRVGGRPVDSTIWPDGTTAKVLRGGKPVLYRSVNDWPDARVVALGTSTTQRASSAIFVPIGFGGRCVGVLSVQSHRENAYDEDDVAVLETCALYLGTRIHDERNAELAQLATTDALTGLPNRRAFDERLLGEWRRCARSDSSLALALIDIDYFKRFNDAYGHVAGDACLRQIAQAIANCARRPGDLVARFGFVARYGGEEFVLILPESDAAGAVHVAESICDAVRGIGVPHEGSSLGYATLSIGVATIAPDAQDDPQSLVAAADTMLYEAKKDGRNRVAAAGHRSEAPAAQPRVILRHNLPRYLTDIIGRERDLSGVVALLHESPLVSIVGPGGVGKTRLAVQVAGQLLEGYSDGVWFVDLAPLDDPAFVTSAIAEAFGIADKGGARPLIERISSALRSKRLLLVLDNCEHVLSAAAVAAHKLLRECPYVRVLATGREPLGIAGETSYRMPALPVPPLGEKLTAESLMRYAAAALFVARARAAQGSFALTDENANVVGDIVRRLDGIPLAIELAAPRIKTLSLEQLTQRLDDRFKLLTGGSRTSLPRQQTLRALIGWSYDLLDEPERSMLRQLAIFPASWTLEAADAICGDERFADWDAFELLSALVDKSLVVVEIEGSEQRYRLLGSTRQFALERLDEAALRHATAARHCRCFAQIAQRDSDAYWQTDQGLWMAHVRLDLENYRAAILWGVSDGNDAAAAATIVAALRWLWVTTANREGRMLLERVAAVLPRDAPVRVRGMLALAGALLESASAQAALPATEAARDLSGGIDEIGRVEALALEAQALGFVGSLAESVALFDAVLAAARATHTPRLIGWVLNLAAYWTFAADDRARARAFFDEAAVLLRACNDRRRLAALQANRSEFLFAQGDPAGALAGAHEAIAAYRERGLDEGALAVATVNMAAYLLALAQLEEAWAAARDGLELALRADVVLQVAIAIGHLGHVAAEGGDPSLAARLLGYTDAAYGQLGTKREPTEQHGYDRGLELIRAALPEDRIRALMAEGASMQQDAAIAEAMTIPQPPRRAIE